MNKLNFKGIYIHIPFCIKKCFYCDFPSYEINDKDTIDRYIDSLCNEINNDCSDLSEVETVFFGGGTPSILKTKHFEKIIKSLENKRVWETAQEKTCEINPGTINFEKLFFLKQLGFNRLSIGVQSFSDVLLKKIGRIHTAKVAEFTIENALKAEFKNINIDLMYALPEQKIEDFVLSLQKAISFDIKHISCYSLILEEDTLLNSMVEKKEVFLPNSDVEEQMYDFVSNYLPKKSFNRYEISNFAKKGFECAHNKIYWQYKPYKGYGASAVSFDGKTRFINSSDIEEFIQYGPLKSNMETLEKKDLLAEYVFMNLRMTKGFLRKDFFDRFNIDIDQVYKKELYENYKKGFLNINDEIKLTKQGMKMGNEVFMSFLK